MTLRGLTDRDGLFATRQPSASVAMTALGVFETRYSAHCSSTFARLCTGAPAKRSERQGFAWSTRSIAGNTSAQRASFRTESRVASRIESSLGRPLHSRAGHLRAWRARGPPTVWGRNRDRKSVV